MQANQLYQAKNGDRNLIPPQPNFNKMDYEESKQAAYSLGGQSYRDNSSSVPSALNVSPSLAAAWLEGREDTRMLDMTHECVHCNNVAGNPCPIHD